MLQSAAGSLGDSNDARAGLRVKGEKLRVWTVQLLVSHAVHDAHEALDAHLTLLFPTLQTKQ